MGKKRSQKKRLNPRVAGGIGLGLAAAAGVAGALFFFGKHGSRNRKNAKDWMLKVKKDIIKELKRAKKLNQSVYNGIVDKVVGRYRSLSHIELGELAGLSRELKSHWRTLNRRLKARPKRSKKRARKS